MTGSAHREDHEKTVHGIDTTQQPITQGTQPTLKETIAQKKGWVQPKKTFINRKVKKLQNEVNKLNKDGNIFNNLHSIPEITDTQNIKRHFTNTVTTKQCKEH